MGPRVFRLPTGVVLAIPLLVAGLAFFLFAGALPAAAQNPAPFTPCQTTTLGTQTRDQFGICPTGEVAGCLPIENCTANDITKTPVNVTEAAAGSGCVVEGGTGRYKLSTTVNANADRYDLGFWFALDNGSAMRSGGGGSCFRDYLNPISPAPTGVNPYLGQGWTVYPTNLPQPPTSLATGYGAFENLQGVGTPHANPLDGCGDINNKFNNGNITYAFHDAVVGLGCEPTTSAGYLTSISWCVTWIQPGDVKNIPSCEKPTDVQPGPGTKAKCNCEPTAANPPICIPPNIQISTPFTQTLSGTDITYDFPIKNAGTIGIGYDVAVTYAFDSRLTYSGGATITGGSCAQTGNPITCNLATLAPGATAMMHVVLHNAPVQTQLNGTISVTSQTSSSVPAGAQRCSYTNSTSVIFTTPVTLSYFRADRHGNGVSIEWSTLNEVGNVGFNLYAQTPAGLQRLNSQLIYSQKPDSMERQDYRFEADKVQADSFVIEDVDILGWTRSHGPFEIGAAFGARTDPKPVDWAAITAEHQSKADARAASDRSDAARQVGQARKNAAAMTEKGPGGYAATAASGYPAFELRVDFDGLYRITYADLQQAGLDLAGVPLSSIAVTNHGVSVPIRVDGPDPFGPGSFIEFYAVGLNTLYTRTNVYTLVVDPALVQRVNVDSRKPRLVAPVSSYMETTVVHNQRNYSSSSPNGDPWYDAYMRADPGKPKTLDFTLPADGYLPSAGGATLSVGLWGYVNWPQSPDHHVIVKVNGTVVADDKFDGIADHVITAAIPAGVLRPGANTMTVYMPGDLGVSWDVVALDRYSLTYPRSFTSGDGRLVFKAAGDVLRVNGLPSSNVVVYRLNGTQTRLTGAVVSPANGSYSVTFPGTTERATYVVSTVEGLSLPQVVPARTWTDIKTGPAQYLIITHPDFAAGLDPLVQARRAQGLAVKVVDVRDIYAQFGYGVFDAQAIGDYIQYAAAAMGTQYVLLVGGDTLDYRNYTGKGAISFIPSLYTQTSDIVRFAPADPLYADLNWDRIPDLAIGRLPVRSTADLSLLVAKTLAYGQKTYGGTAVFAADGQDAGVSFSAISDRLLQGLPGWNVQRAYMDGHTVLDARTALLAAINNGVALVNFVGHSSDSRWTYDGLFDITYAQALSNAGKPTAVVQWGCWNTYYVGPYATLADALLLSGDRGAAALLGATGLASSSSEEALAALLTPKLTQPGMTIGAAVQSAKAQLAATQRNTVDVLLGWTLLGDPALIVQP